MSVTVKPGVGTLEFDGLTPGESISYKLADAVTGATVSSGTAKIPSASIQTKLSADGRAVEVTAVPAGTTTITVAMCKSLTDTPTYLHEKAELQEMLGTPERPFISMIASNATEALGIWTQRLKTTPPVPSNPTPPAPTPIPPAPVSIFTPGLGIRASSPASMAATFALKPHHIRFEVSGPTAEYKSLCEQAVANGVEPRPLLTYPFVGTPDFAGLAVKGTKRVEFGNELSMSYKNPTPAIARKYAEDGKRMAQVLKPLGVGVVFIGEDGDFAHYWLKEMIAAVPDLLSWVDGWAIHPYTEQTSPHGTDPAGIPTLERMIHQLHEIGDDHLPIDVTEWGLPSDADGSALVKGGGFDYKIAGEIAQENIPKIRAAGQGRIRAFSVYQSEDQEPSGFDANGQHFFGIVRANGAGTKAQYTEAIKGLLAAA